METNLTLPEQSEIPVHKCPRARIVDFLRGNLWMPFLVLGLAALASYFLLFKTENSNNLAETIINLTCAAAIFLGIQRNQPANKTAWYFILAGFTVFGLANIPTTYWIWSSGGTQPFPSIADAGYLSTGPLICIGLVLFIRNREHLKRNRGYIIDAAIFGVGAGFPIYTLLIAPNLFDPGVPLLSRLVSAAYPTADVLLIGVAIAFILGPGRRSLAYRILAASFVALLTSDLAFSGAILNGSYAIGSLITAGWPLFSILGATAALHPSMAHVNQPHTEGQHRLTKARVIFLAGGMLSVSIVHTLIEHTYSGRALEVFVVTAVLFGLLSARLLEFQQERKLYEQKLAHQALHDPLTDLANSALFRDRVAHLLQRRESSARSFALYFLDLDDFKTINDELGHAAGDELLCGVGERLTKTMRSEDTVARMGGDEFAILAERGSGSDDWHERLARRILDTTKLPYEVAGKLILMRASLGVVLHDGATQGTQINDLLRDADMAMYTAKAHGKGRFELFDEAMQIGARDRIAVESEMILGIERGEFVAFYQPIVSMSDGVVRASEALVRWNHPTRGLLAPGEFMDIAEETGLIVPLGRQVLAEACNHLAECKTHAASPLGLRMHVNVSVAQLHDVGLKAHLKRLLAENAIDPCDLVLEITETTLIHDIEGMAEVLKDLKEIGIRIAIDDFGTGYSSLSRLRHFPIDILKIDKAFVDGITHGPEDAAVVGALITLARGLNMEIVAEGVERADQLKELHRMGCAFAQGYLLGRPSPAEHFVDGSSSLEPERFIRV